MRQKVGNDFSIGLKINSSDFTPNGFSESDSITVIKKMSELGVDLIEISGENYENPTMLNNHGGAFFIQYAAKVKKEIKAPIIVTGGFRSIKGMESALENDETELVGVARALALVPNLPNLAAKNQFSSINLDYLSTGFKKFGRKISSLIGLTYYEMQMHRLAQGKSVKRTKNTWIPLMFAFKKQGISFMLPRRS